MVTPTIPLIPPDFVMPSYRDMAMEIGSKIEALWLTFVKNLCYVLYFNCGMQRFSLTLCTWLTEPISALIASIHFPLGLTAPFTVEGVNPQTLTEEQLSRPPILLIHGNYANPATFIPLIRKLKETQAAIFTVTLDHGDITEQDHTLIASKLREIKNLFSTRGVADVKIDLIGHSRGARLAFETWQREKEAIRTVCRLAWATHESEASDEIDWEHLFEVVAKRDLILTHKSQHPDSQQIFESAHGHLGVLMDPLVHEKIVDWLTAFPSAL